MCLYFEKEKEENAGEEYSRRVQEGVQEVEKRRGVQEGRSEGNKEERTDFGSKDISN